METIIRVGLLVLFGVALTLCYGMFRYATQPQVTTTYNAPHIVNGYADTDGDGFVPAQGDPLYDAHYAQEVNQPNSEALQRLAQIPGLVADANYTQAQADQIEAETERIQQDTKMSLWGTRIILAIAVATVLLIAVAIFAR